MSEAAVSFPLAPWLERQLNLLVDHNGHALLLHGPSGLGQYPLALALAQAWLCQQPTATAPNGAVVCARVATALRCVHTRTCAC